MKFQHGANANPGFNAKTQFEIDISILVFKIKHEDGFGQPAKSRRRGRTTKAMVRMLAWTTRFFWTWLSEADLSFSVCFQK